MLVNTEKLPLLALRRPKHSYSRSHRPPNSSQFDFAHCPEPVEGQFDFAHCSSDKSVESFARLQLQSAKSLAIGTFSANSILNRSHGGIQIDTCQGKKLLDFSANINPLGLVPGLCRTIQENLKKILRYPEPESRGFKQRLADFYGLKPENLLIGNGSIELIYLIPRALRIKTALLVIPSFSEYEYALRINNTRIFFARTYPRDDFKIDFNELCSLAGRVELVFLGNPNNPTGQIIYPEGLAALMATCRKNNTILAIDEAFMDFVLNGEKLSLLASAARQRNILVLRSLTKFFAIPGLRLGYLVGHCDRVKQISCFQYPWNVNSLAQAVGRSVLGARAYIQKSRDMIEKENQYLFFALKGIKGLTVFPSAVNFILARLEGKKITDAKALNSRLFKQGIIARDCANFRGLDRSFFRVAVRSRRENIRLIKALKKIISQNLGI